MERAGPGQRSLHDAVVVVDAHAHGVGLLPRPVDRLYRRLAPTRPADVAFSELPAAGVNALVAKAVGDGVVTRWRPGENGWAAVRRQLADLAGQASGSGGRVVRDLAEAASLGPGPAGPTVILGLEGADPVGLDPQRLDDLHRLGVRVVGLVHYVDNRLGTVCLPWQGWVPVPLPARRRRPGLTPLGGEVVDRMNDLGMVVDLAHADRATTLAACERTRAPLISSHTGARALQDFARFVGDDEARAIAGTGGLVGLWPFHYRGRGVADVDDFARHAGHLAALVGPQHLCVGTDMNGVSGHMHGFRDARDFRVLTDALVGAGFSTTEVAGIVGGNLLRVFAAVAAAAAR